MDNIIVLKDNTVSEQGTYQELIENKGAFADFLLEHMAGMKDNEEELGQIVADLQNALGRDGSFKEKFQSQMTRQESVSSGADAEGEKKTRKGAADTNGGGATAKAGTNLIQDETAATGSVGKAVYAYYLKSIGLSGAISIVLLLLTSQAASLGNSLWVETWTAGDLVGNSIAIIFFGPFVFPFLSCSFK